MKATITTTNKTITGRNITQIYKTLQGMLSVGGCRGITAITESGTVIHTELYSGQDYIRTRDGRNLIK